MLAPLVVAYLISVPPAENDHSPQTHQDLQTLGWKRPIDADELLKRIRFQTLTKKERREVEANIEKLSAKTYREREKAMRDLMYANPGVDPLLRAKLGDAGAETRRRLEQMLRVQRGRWTPEKAEASIRLLHEIRPEGAADALLAFLPFADDRWVALETVSALRSLGVDSRRIAESLPTHFGIEADPASPADAARQAARRFFTSLVAQDRDELRAICSLPFLIGMLALESDTELDEVFEHGAAGYKADGKLLDVSLGAVVRGEACLTKLTENDANAVRRIMSDRLRAVEISIRVDMRRQETGYVLVEMRSEGARVVGLLDGPRTMQSRP
ncbi:MAG: hypothetical protein U0744_05070 [Gemmataceae bacterium]